MAVKPMVLVTPCWTELSVLKNDISMEEYSGGSVLANV
jgi:hypothetical protein